MAADVENHRASAVADSIAERSRATVVQISDVIDRAVSAARGIGAIAERAGKSRLLAFHVCDWLVPTKDILNDRGMMGDGVIDIKSVRAAVEAQGFTGYSEIEIFSDAWWGRPMDEVIATCIARHRTVV